MEFRFSSRFKYFPGYFGVVLFALLVLGRVTGAQCWSPNFTPGMVFKTTGDPSLDQKFNAEGTFIFDVFGVDPNMVVFDDGGNPNAFASPQMTAPGYTGTV